MIITINAIEVATDLADSKTSFKTHNKIQSTVGIDYTIEDVRDTDEWKKHYNYYVTVLKSKRLIK